jgi:hypothetical protein
LFYFGEKGKRGSVLFLFLFNKNKKQKQKKMMSIQQHDPRPLLLFDSPQRRDAFYKALNWIELEQPPIEMGTTFVYQYQTPFGEAFMASIRVMGGALGFIETAHGLTPHFVGHVIIFHPELEPGSVIRPNLNGAMRELVNPSMQDVVAILNLAVGAEEMAQLLDIHPMQDRRRNAARGNVLDLDAIFALGRGNHAPPIPAEADQADADLQRGLLLSMEQPPPPMDLIPVEEAWLTVLKEKADPIKPGQPVCVVCKDKRASICFITCGHQVTCDECCLIMRQLPNAMRNCPICRLLPRSIVRPITSEEAPPPLLVEKKKPAKKRAKK